VVEQLPMASFELRGDRVAVVGATGAVGREMIKLLRHMELFAFASTRSAGGVVEDIPVAEFSVEAVVKKGCKYVLLAVNGDFAQEYAPRLMKAGCIVIDNSSAFRYDEGIPLVVPSLNGHVLKPPNSRGMIIANPNCTTAILAMVVHPLHKTYKLRKIVASTYQAASGAGEPGMRELEQAMAHRVQGQAFAPSVFSHDLSNNVIPRIDCMQPNGYTKEEMKLAWETQKILADENISISCTAVRVPTQRAHCISATLESSMEMCAEDVRALLSTVPGVVVKDDPGKNVYPLPESASGQAAVEVGRIRQSLVFGSHGVDLFVCGDQLLRGAALNAVEILEFVKNFG
jgi:aspartate-semialdehyde dehydrogenase